MPIDLTDLALRLIGTFYAFAGVVATRAAISSHFIDRALAQLSMKKPPFAETAQFLWLLIASLIVLMGGAILMLKLDAAVWLFLVSATLQALYLFVIAPRWFDAEDPPDPVGRQRTTNAFVVYLAATTFVVWAFAAGRLLTADQVPLPALLGVGAAIVAYAGHIAWLLGVRGS